MVAWLTACARLPAPDIQAASNFTATATIAPIATRPVITSPSTPTRRPLTPTATPVPQPSPTSVAHSLLPCQPPPDDYQRVTVGSETVNARTLWMLKLAQTLYQGRGDPLNITQGSYVDSVAASFGTHAGGGAVDISVRVKSEPAALLNEREMTELVTALRQAGFAAWARLPGDLDILNGVHIHAIAVGDRELSVEARRQLDGPEGYFLGLDGVPPEHGGPKIDRYGGPVLCDWMSALGYQDLR